LKLDHFLSRPDAETAKKGKTRNGPYEKRKGYQSSFKKKAGLMADPFLNSKLTGFMGPPVYSIIR